MNTLLDFILHLDVYLAAFAAQFGALTYGLLFLIIFCETGLVFTPFLPGDSLIFVAAALAGQGALQVYLLWTILTLAAILGDSVNYWVGMHFGLRLEKSKRLRPEYMEKTHYFYKKYGKKAIVMARFIPIVRTFAPFVAGMARMNYRDFLFYNIVGAVAWVSLFVLGGLFFGQIPWVHDNLEKVILGIVLLSFVPPLLEWWKGTAPKV